MTSSNEIVSFIECNQSEEITMDWLKEVRATFKNQSVVRILFFVTLPVDVIFDIVVRIILYPR